MIATRPRGTLLCLMSYWSVGCLAEKLDGMVEIGLSPPPRMPVTTRIIIFLVVDPNLNFHLPLASWEGGQPKV